MPKLPTRSQHETQPIAGSEAAADGAQPAEAGASDQPQPIEPDPAEIVDAHRTERPVEDMGGEID